MIAELGVRGDRLAWFENKERWDGYRGFVHQMVLSHKQLMDSI